MKTSQENKCPPTTNDVHGISEAPIVSLYNPEDEAIANQCLFTNILAFPYPTKWISFWVSDKAVDSYRRFHFRKLPNNIHQLVEGLDEENPFVWLTTHPDDNEPELKVELSAYPAVACYWYTQQIYEYMSTQVRLTRVDYIGNHQYWQEVPSLNTRYLLAFRKFTISVITTQAEDKAELLVTYDGLSYVLKYSLMKLTEIFKLDTKMVGKVVFKKQIEPYKHLGEEATSQPDKIYPVLTREMTAVIPIEFPFNHEKLKLTMTYHYITDFYHQFLGTEGFLRIIPHRKTWNMVSEDQQSLLKNRSRDLMFGGHHLNDNIYQGIVNQGPAIVSPCPHIKIFMIYHQQDDGKAKLLKDFVTGKKGFVKLGQVTRRPLVYMDELDIVFNDSVPITEQLEPRIRMMEMEAETDYFAFYLSPFQKTSPNPEERRVYYQVKELLLGRYILSQTIDSHKFQEKNFGLSIVNIGMAMVAKLGGIPWQLGQQPVQELIIGFGASRIKRKGMPYLGSSFCFDNRGSFQEFDCWPADAEWALHGTLAKAIKSYRKQNPNVERVVIHYYKELSRKDFKRIDELIDDLDADIPVIVVRINTTFSQSELVLNPVHPEKLPMNGNYVRLKYHQYLLHINDNEEGTKACGKAPMPLKLSFQSNRAGLMDDPDLIERLMRQVYEFSLLHWRSVRQPRLPVTVEYPQMMAQIFPWFRGEVMPEAGRKRLWFL
ncbi:MAG: hypothetical protein A2W85_03480 [Bacteroidetes bacterium GWF2_41_31]|nr:MAG: hypothetical protein A2W85_03480 [Bacteroidetes bacterium GWF2_41_31]